MKNRTLKANRTLTKAFENLSLSEAFNCRYASLGSMPDKELELLKGVCENAPKSITEAFKFLEEEDELFCYIYDSSVTLGDEKYYSYPFLDAKRSPEGISMAFGPIGAQNSRFHEEKLSEHVAMVQVNLEEAGIPREIAGKIAVLHDVGKKYTSSTNSMGDISSINHAEVSAFIASHWLKQWNMEEQDKKVLVAVILAHMKPFTDWRTRSNHRIAAINKRGAFNRQLISFLGDDTALAKKTMQLIDLIARCDEGIVIMNDEAITKIIKGRNILLNLDERL